MSLPENIVDKIMLYNSHPVADLIKATIQVTPDRWYQRNTTYENYKDERLFYTLMFQCHPPKNKLNKQRKPP